MHTPSNKDRLSKRAALYVELEEAQNENGKFLTCVKHAAEIYTLKQFGRNHDHLLSIIMGMIKTHLSGGINPNNVLIENKPAIFTAIGFPQLLKLLLSHGANPNSKTHGNSTPLHLIASHCRFYKEPYRFLICAELLASKNADHTLPDAMRAIPLDHIVDYADPSKTESSFLELRENFRQATESPRSFDDIPFEIIEEVADETIPLTQEDLAMIQTYRAKNQRERSHPRVLQVGTIGHVDRGRDIRQVRSDPTADSNSSMNSSHAMSSQIQPATPRTGPFSGMRFGFIQSDHRHNNEPLDNPGDYTHRR